MIRALYECIFDILKIEGLTAKVEVEFLEKPPRITVGGISLQNIDKGTRIMLPFWMASILKQRNIVRIVGELDERKLKSSIFNEKAINRVLTDIGSFPYMHTYSTASTLDADAQKKLKNTVERLMSLRLGKIIHLVPLSVFPSNIPNISNEEKFLYENIKKLLEAWKKKLEEFK